MAPAHGVMLIAKNAHVHKHTALFGNEHALPENILAQTPD